jgi:DNA mismatch repair protein MutS
MAKKKGKLTPMMQQYFEIKKQYDDHILFYRLGDFYEMFFEDAIVASRELELTLTGRNCGLEERAPLCGIPYHSAESYMGRLIEKGFKVAVCEQVEDPATAKGLVKREVVRIITPGTVIEPGLLDERANNYVMALFDNDEGTGIAYADITTGELKATMFDAEADYHKITDEILKVAPREIIIPKDFGIRNIIMSTIDKYDHIMLTQFDHTVFKTENAHDTIKRLFKVYSAEGLGIESIFIISALGGLMSYIEDTQKVPLVHLDHVEIYTPDHYMILDKFTRRNLELTETMRGKDKKGSLLWVLDKTATSMGARTLKKWIEEPILNKGRIEDRQQAVETLVDDIVMRDELREKLSEIYDLERLSSKLVYNNVNARDMIALKNSLNVLPDIIELLEEQPVGMLENLLDQIDPLSDVHTLIDEAVMEEPPISLREGNIIKSGYNADVAELRDAVVNGKNWIMGIEQRERERTSIKSLKIGFNKVFGYYIDVTRANSHLVPDDYEGKQTLANSERYITPELKEIEEKVLGSEEKIVVLEYKLFTELREEILQHVSRIQKTAKAIAALDVLQSFAVVSERNNYSKPVVLEDSELIIREGRHPVVERIAVNELFVPNSTQMDDGENQFYIITGPNMAGKSTYLRQVALITLMAQIGCFVPAEFAQIGIVDRIFTRVGASDDLSQGQSTFMVEMSELANILHNATKNSLVILDEIGRGTSTYDGLSIAWAVVEYLTEEGGIRAKTMFATHYHELTELEGRFRGVKNFCISVKESGDDIVFLHKIIRGGANQSYGIQVAKLAGVPYAVIEKAKRILSKLEENDINRNVSNLTDAPEVDHVREPEETFKENKEAPVQISLFDTEDSEIVTRLKETDVMSMTPMDAMNLVYELVQKAKKM